MGPISILLLVIFVISALLIVALVMIQDEGGEGLGGIFGGGGGSQQIGNRSGNILTKTTSILGAVFMLTAFGLAWFNRSEGGDLQEAAAQLRGEGARVEWWNVEPGETPAAEEELEIPSIEMNGEVDTLDVEGEE